MWSSCHLAAVSCWEFNKILVQCIFPLTFPCHTTVTGGIIVLWQVAGVLKDFELQNPFCNVAWSATVFLFCSFPVLEQYIYIFPSLVFLGGSEKLLRVCLNLPYFLRYINRFQDAVSANSFFIMPATVADATAVRNGYFQNLCKRLKCSNAV